MASLLLLQATVWAQAESPLTISDGVHKAHMFPTRSLASHLPTDNGPLLYNGGPVMTGGPQGTNFYIIYWLPAKLQNGGSTSMSAHYMQIQKDLIHDYQGHDIGSNNTQYYQTVSGVTTYIESRWYNYYTYVDTNAYPASGCTDIYTPGNCITDAQIQTEIQRVMKLEGWTGGIQRIFLLYASILPVAPAPIAITVRITAISAAVPRSSTPTSLTEILPTARSRARPRPTVIPQRIRL
jgi:hypothetical protein